MIKLAFYGKGGIGKSTTVSNMAVAFAQMGYKVMQIGCDPKADSTMNLREGKEKQAVLDILREKNKEATLDDVITQGYAGVYLVEAGGPIPGLGCAGRGIIAAMEFLDEKKAYDIYQPDIVLFDVLGDVVCGGFSMPIREGYADEILIVTSGEKMALYAANNINTAVNNFKDRSYAQVRGLILNRRNVPSEEEKVKAFANENHLSIVCDVPRSDEINEWEDQGKTVIEGNPNSPISKIFFDLAKDLMEDAS